MKQLTTPVCQDLAERRLRRILTLAKKYPGLAKLGPKTSWSAEVKIVGKTLMSRLNLSYRGKGYPTDVLSFPTLAPFRKAGHLGELVICLPVLKAQARALKHSSELELEVLLTHGVLHLLGLDHEKGPRQAAVMARWEAKILRSSTGKLLGLIDRSESGI